MNAWSKIGGGTPFGYKYDRKTNRLVTVPAEIKILKIIFNLAVEGNGVTKIANYLNNNNYTSKRGGGWFNTTVGYLLQPQRLLFYQGIDKNGEKGDWEAIITKESSEKIIGYKRTIKSAKSRAIYLLSSRKILKCGYCGSYMIVGKNKDTAYYSCATRLQRSKDLCPESKMHRIENIEHQVVSDFNVRKSLPLIKYFNKDKKNKLQLINEQLGKLNKLNNSTIDNLKKIISMIEEYQEYQFPPEINDLSDIVKEINVTNEAIKITYKFPINNSLSFTTIIQESK
jgi:hypothetical protein